MIEFNSENNFQLSKPNEVTKWLQQVIQNEDCSLGELSFVFCSDDFLHNINVEFLGHDTFTDIITFDYSLATELHGEIYISTDRVKENSVLLGHTMVDELHRVMVHGVLHLCGFKDKTKGESRKMRELENNALSQRIFLKR